ncbi:MAG: hypothetical protein Tsb009_29120 [Planctomycetaceae bacterium]
MVRNARFSWDEFDNVDIPRHSPHFDDLDDPDVDELVADPNDEADVADENPRPPKHQRTKETKKQRKGSRQNESDSRRHLADADWLTDDSNQSPNSKSDRPT